MYTTYITLIAKRFDAELPVFLVKMIAEMTKDREEIPIYIRDCVGHPYCQPGHKYSERTILFCDTGRIKSMVSGYNATFEDMLYPGQNLRSPLDDRQKMSKVYLNLRGYLYEINMFWRKYIDDYKKMKYYDYTGRPWLRHITWIQKMKYDYTAPSLILESLPDLERIFETVEQGRMSSYDAPVGNAEIYLKPRYTIEELQTLWPNLFMDE